jgi:hypothetical protein
MMFGQDRNQMRQFFMSCWKKYKTGQPLEPIEALISGVIAAHPEYHELIESGSQIDKDYSPDEGQTNPFLHMGMHISIREQIQADRPAGIKQAHEKLSAKLADQHEAEHKMQECLGLILWEAQRAGAMPDEQKYLECVRKLL